MKKQIVSAIALVLAVSSGTAFAANESAKSVKISLVKPLPEPVLELNRGDAEFSMGDAHATSHDIHFKATGPGRLSLHLVEDLTLTHSLPKFAAYTSAMTVTAKTDDGGSFMPLAANGDKASNSLVLRTVDETLNNVNPGKDFEGEIRIVAADADKLTMPGTYTGELFMVLRNGLEDLPA